LISYHAILAVAMLNGDDGLAKTTLDKSIRVDPKNFIVRYKYFATLQTRWGGSLPKHRTTRQIRQKNSQASVSL
jgi:hypothetical protein